MKLLRLFDLSEARRRIFNRQIVASTSNVGGQFHAAECRTDGQDFKMACMAERNWVIDYPGTRRSSRADSVFVRPDRQHGEVRQSCPGPSAEPRRLALDTVPHDQIKPFLLQDCQRCLCRGQRRRHGRGARLRRRGRRVLGMHPTPAQTMTCVDRVPCWRACG